MAGILEYSTTAASNTTLNGIGIAGSNSVKNGDDALRQLMADAASAVTQVIDKSANYTAVKADYRQMIRATATMTLNLTVAATLTAGWCLWVKADGGTVTVDPAGTEKINGANTLTLVDGSAAFIVCTGTAFQAVILNAPFDTGTLGDAAFKDTGTTAGTVAAGDDARLSDAREWTAATVSQAEAEAGTATDRRAWTAERVKQAIAANAPPPSGLGVGQSWADVTASRSGGTAYQNTTGKPIAVHITAGSSAIALRTFQVSNDNVTWGDLPGVIPGNGATPPTAIVGPFIIPNNTYYRVSGGLAGGFKWMELR